MAIPAAREGIQQKLFVALSLLGVVGIGANQTAICSPFRFELASYGGISAQSRAYRFPNAAVGGVRGALVIENLAKTIIGSRMKLHFDWRRMDLPDYQW